MIKLHFLSFLFILFIHNGFAQTNYKDSMLAYQQKYVNEHEVVQGSDKQFLKFYDIDESYRVLASFKRIADAIGVNMPTSTSGGSKYFKYGVLTFKIKDSVLQLYVYQSPTLMSQAQYKDYLFVPFGDATSGVQSYGGGRYIDISIPDIKNDQLLLDFNKAYNPYCAYGVKYSCPLPPIENLLHVPIPAGEKNYGKPVKH